MTSQVYSFEPDEVSATSSSSSSSKANGITNVSVTDRGDSTTPVKVQSYEFKRDNVAGVWEPIKVGSLDWHEITASHSKALVVRVSSIVNENEPEEVMERLRAEDFAADAPTPALHVVCMFKEFAVSESSPVRFTANFLFIFPTLQPHSPVDFKRAISLVLPTRSISYITAEMLGSFLARRDYEAHAVTKIDAQDRLAQFVREHEPCSSFFLKMSPVVPEFCRALLVDIPEGEARELVGVRAIHKLAISCTSSSMASQHNFNETMNVMKIGVQPRHWNFVVFKTLMRLATKNDRLCRRAMQYGNELCEGEECVEEGKVPSGTQVQHMHSLVISSDLDSLEKLAVRIISSSENPGRALRDEEQPLVDFMVGIITSEKDYLSNEDFKRLLNIIEDGRPAACHLTGVLLEKCIEEENFNIGWRVASTVESVNEHTIEEVVTLCSKAFFKYSRNQASEANKWFNRVKWCFERHHKLLGKYPSGLALHVAAHRRDFELCWRWFQGKKEDRAFRFSAHHTSSILKAASYAPRACHYMREVLQAYDMTPVSQKSAFVFEPLVHLWNATADCRDDYRIFWAAVEHDLRVYLERELKDPDPVDRKMRKLSHWECVLSEWSAESTYTIPSPSSMRGIAPAFSPNTMHGQPIQHHQNYQTNQERNNSLNTPHQTRRRSNSWAQSGQIQRGGNTQWIAPGRDYCARRRGEIQSGYYQQHQRWSPNMLGIDPLLYANGPLANDSADYAFPSTMSPGGTEDRWLEQQGLVVGSPVDSYSRSTQSCNGNSGGYSTRSDQMHQQQQQPWLSHVSDPYTTRRPSIDNDFVSGAQQKSWPYSPQPVPYQTTQQYQQYHSPQYLPSQAFSPAFDPLPSPALSSSMPLESLNDMTQSLSRSFADSLSIQTPGEAVEGVISAVESPLSTPVSTSCIAVAKSIGEDSGKIWPSTTAVKSQRSAPQWTHAVGLPM